MPEMTRHRRRARPNAPRMAPTAMKTVPSGAEECFIKGALMVGGTAAAGYVGIPKPRVKEAVILGPSSVSSALSVVLVGASDEDSSVVSAASSVVLDSASSVVVDCSSSSEAESVVRVLRLPVSEAELFSSVLLSSSLLERVDSESPLSLLSLLLLF